MRGTIEIKVAGIRQHKINFDTSKTGDKMRVVVWECEQCGRENDHNGNTCKGCGAVR